MELLSLFFIAVITLLPILLWGYIFSYLDNSELNTKRFLIGIVAGAISVVPVLYLSDFLSFLSFDAFNIFPLLARTGEAFSIMSAFAIMIALIALVIFCISFGIFFDATRQSSGLLLKNALIIVALGFGFALFQELLSSLSLFETPLKNGGVTLGNTTYDTVKLVLFYYLVIGIVEEASKHFSMVTSSVSAMDSVKKWVLFAVFIALGFGFIENILYLKNIAGQSGLTDASLYSTWIFRSIFSLIVHILCSVTVALYFSRAFLVPEKTPFFEYARVLLFWFLGAITLHAIFDISLTLGFTGIIFVYFIFWYLGITRIFYQE